MLLGIIMSFWNTIWFCYSTLLPLVSHSPACPFTVYLLPLVSRMSQEFHQCSVTLALSSMSWPPPPFLVSGPHSHPDRSMYVNTKSWDLNMRENMQYLFFQNLFASLNMIMHRPIHFSANFTILFVFTADKIPIVSTFSLSIRLFVDF